MSKSSSNRPPQPDATDWRIIELLRQDAQSYSAIAAKLGVSEGMVRKRVHRLRRQGVLIVRGLINPEVLSGHQLAVIGVSVTESRLLDAKAREISQLENVLSVSIVSGRYDLLVELLVDSNQGLVRFLTQTLSSVKGIAKTESFLLLKSYRKYV